MEKGTFELKYKAVSGERFFRKHFFREKEQSGCVWRENYFKELAHTNFGGLEIQNLQGRPAG